MKVFIDNNFWDYFAEKNVSLIDFFPKRDFELCITTHGYYEVLQMPERCELVKKYALSMIGSFVKEDAIFGFWSDLFPEKYQRASGFGKGRWGTREENMYRNELFRKYGAFEKRRNELILFKEEADIEIATRAMFYPIITFDTKKKGPIYYVSKNGGKVVFANKNESKVSSVNVFMTEIVERVIKLEHNKKINSDHK